MFGARMQLTGENPAIARGDGRLGLDSSTRRRANSPGDMTRRNWTARFGQNDEFLAARARRQSDGNGDPVFFVDRMTEFAGEEFLGLRVGIHALSG